MPGARVGRTGAPNLFVGRRKGLTPPAVISRRRCSGRSEEEVTFGGDMRLNRLLDGRGEFPATQPKRALEPPLAATLLSGGRDIGRVRLCGHEPDHRCAGALE